MEFIIEILKISNSIKYIEQFNLLENYFGLSIHQFIWLNRILFHRNQYFAKRYYQSYLKLHNHLSFIDYLLQN